MNVQAVRAIFWIELIFNLVIAALSQPPEMLEAKSGKGQPHPGLFHTDCAA